MLALPREVSCLDLMRIGRPYTSRFEGGSDIGRHPGGPLAVDGLARRPLDQMGQPVRPRIGEPLDQRGEVWSGHQRSLTRTADIFEPPRV